MKKIISFVFLCLLFPVDAFAKLSSDPFVSQWSYNDVNVFGAWDYSVGSKEVVVAVIDNGFDTFHPDLFDNVWKNTREIEKNGIDDDANGYVDDVWGWNFVQEDTNGDRVLSPLELKGNNDPSPETGTLTDFQKQEGVFNHGTVVAGIIGAVGDNAKYGAGINWKVRLMNLKVIDNSGSGDILLLGPAIRYAVDNGASIINISMVGNFIEGESMSALRYAKQKGVAVFAAVGNDQRFLVEQPRYPVCADHGESEQLVIGVSAIDETHHLAPFSNYGSNCVDITAPGMRISGTLRFDPSAGLSSGYGGAWNGTSFATPFVSGAAALVKAIQPTWTAENIYGALLSTVHKTPPKDDMVYTHLFGKGLLQIDKAVRFALSGTPVSSPSPAPIAPPPQVVLPQPLAPVPSVKPLDVFLFNDTAAQGEIFPFSKSVFSVPQSSKEMLSFQGLESISRYQKQSGESVYGVLYFRADGNSIVRLYDASFQRIDGFRKKFTSPSTLVVADVVGDSQPEIILAPKNSEKRIFTVFSPHGEELFFVDAPENHSGVSITKKYNSTSHQDEISVIYKQGSRVFLDSYNGKKEKVFSKELSAKTELGGLFFGDVDGDGVSEYTMIVVDGNTVWVRYYSEEGNFIKRIPVFQLRGAEKKVQFAFDDFDADGSFELLIHEKFGGGSLYGVFQKGSSVQKLYSFSSMGKNIYFVIPFVK